MKFNELDLLTPKPIELGLAQGVFYWEPRVEDVLFCLNNAEDFNSIIRYFKKLDIDLSFEDTDYLFKIITTLAIYLSPLKNKVSRQELAQAHNDTKQQSNALTSLFLFISKEANLSFNEVLKLPITRYNLILTNLLEQNNKQDNKKNTLEEFIL